MKNLENFKTQELSVNELEKVNGGFLVALAAAAVGAYLCVAWSVCYDMGKSYR